jgi:hypothetical protein
MITVTDLDNNQVQIDEDLIALIAGPYSNDVGPHTYVYASDPILTVTAEAPDSLVARIGNNPPMAVLARPNDTPVWIAGRLATSVTAPVKGEYPAAVKAIVYLGKLGPFFKQAVKETVRVASAAINAAGGNV